MEWDLKDELFTAISVNESALVDDLCKYYFDDKSHKYAIIFGMHLVILFNLRTNSKVLHSILFVAP